MSKSANRSLLALAATLAGVATFSTACELADYLSGDCETYKAAWEEDLIKSGELSPNITASTEGFPMAMMLNQNAINELFARLADTELPTLTQSFRVLGQQVGVSVRPQIPLLAIGGNARCVDCLSASVPFNVGLGFGSSPPPVGGGTIAVQMPVGMIPDDDRKTGLVASFQRLDVTSLDLNLGSGVANNLVDSAEPIINTLLTAWLRTRFENARIATIDSWALGRGDVLLAGRGPFVHPESGTIVIAMQSNLKTVMGSPLQVDPNLPEGADIGFVFHPELLLSMGRRMNYEGVIPQNYSADGTSDESNGGGVRLSLQSMTSGDDQLLRTTTRLHSISNLCGSADLAASFGLAVEPGKFSFAVRDVEFVGGEGAGQLFGATDWIASQFLDSLTNTLEFTVNYDQVFGGEAQEQPEMGAFRASIDSRGIGVYLNVIPGI